MKSTFRRSVLVSLLTGLLLFGAPTAANDTNAYIVRLLTEMGVTGLSIDTICEFIPFRCENGVATRISFSTRSGLPDHTVAPFNTYNYEEMSIRRISCDDCELPWGSLPAAWGRMKSLRDISLWNCRLTGTLPPEWSSLNQLEDVVIDNNELTGTLPAEWSTLTKLKSLELSDNRLTGTLPAEWSRLTNIKIIELSNNRLTGTLPPEWNSMTLLSKLELDLNVLMGTLPAQWDNMTELYALYLNDNQLSGCIPESYTTQVFPSLQFLDLQMNPQMTGCVPPSWRDPQSELYDAYSSLVEDNSPLVLENCTPCSKETAKPEKGGLSTGAIVGIVVGSVIAVVAILFLIIFFCCCRKDKKDVKSAADATGVAGGCATSAPLAENSEAACSFPGGEDEGPIRSGNEKPSTKRYSYYDDLH